MRRLALIFSLFLTSLLLSSCAIRYQDGLRKIEIVPFAAPAGWQSLPTWQPTSQPSEISFPTEK